MSKETILIVEDDGIIAKRLQDILIELGYNVPMPVATGEEAVEKAGEICPDLILMDIYLAGDLNGIETATQIRNNYDIPILYLTAFSEDALLHHAKITEPYGYLVKPVQNRELYASIEMALYRHGLEKRLKENEEWLKKTLQSIGDAVIATDEKGLIKFMNPVAEVLTGWKQREACGCDLYEVFHIINENTREPVRDIVKKIIQSGKVIGLANSTMLIRKDKTEIPIDDSGSPILNEKGNISGIVIVFRDVSEHKQMEARLRHAQKMEAIGTLSSGIAHDFNNIIFPIIGYADMAIDDTPEKSHVRNCLEEISKAGSRAKELIQQILTFSRSIEKQFAPVKIQSIIKEIIKLFRSSIPMTIKLHHSIKESCGYIMADPTQIYQIIINLCTNASYAMRESGGVLFIGLDEVKILPEDLDSSLKGIYTDTNIFFYSPDMKPGNYVRVSVSDTGTGIDGKIKERLFDPYFTTKPPEEGTGLGLAMVHGIVMEYNGYIGVRSKLGKGTTFDIFLPRIDPVDTAPEKKTFESIPKGNEHILVVDDEEQNTDMLRHLLTKLGYQVTALYDSVETLKVFQSQPQAYDLLLTDTTMPNMTGVDLAKLVLKTRPYMPIIISTGYSDLISDEKAKALGIRKLIMKPCSIKVLAKAIRDVIDECKA